MLDLMSYVSEYLASPAGQDAIAKHAAKVVNDAIGNAMGYSSEFKKQIDAAVAKSLQLTSDVDLPSCNDAILKILTRQMQAELLGKKAEVSINDQLPLPGV